MSVERWVPTPDLMQTQPLIEPASEPIKRLGRYPVVGELGSGGMGVVLRVHDPELGREVAAKVIRGEASDAQLTRFMQEARVTGGLDHPNIVPVHELQQTPEGQAYFTMKAVGGQTLAERLERKELPLAARLEIFLKICDAIAFAHSRNVIHRDLKPTNVMVGDFGEVLVMDWGLAKVLGQGKGGERGSSGRRRARPRSDESARASAATVAESGGQTMDGDVLGTPAYMPPEQARGEIDRLDRRADVYALGAILYELLAGAPPYEAATPWGVVEQVIAGPPPRLSERDGASVPWELEAVVERAMARSLRRRYQSVAGLRADVARYIEGGTLAAANYSPWQLMGKLAGRYRTALVALLVVLVLGSVSAAVAIVQIDEARRAEADAAARQKTAAEEAVREAARARDAEKDSARATREAREALAVARRETARAQRAEQATAAAAEEVRGALERARLSAQLQTHERQIAQARTLFYAASLDPRASVAAIERTLTELRAMLDADPPPSIEARLRSLIGRGLSYRGQAADAQRHLQRAIAINPEDDWSRFELGRLRALDQLVALSAPGRASPQQLLSFRQASQEILVLFPPERELKLAPLEVHQAGMLRALLRLDFVRARALAREGLERFAGQMGVESYHAISGYLTLGPAELAALLITPDARARQAAIERQLRATLAGWTAALAIKPHDAMAFYCRGVTQRHLSAPDRAIEDFSRAVEIAPTLRVAWLARAELRLAAGQHADALADIDRAIRLQDDWQARLLRAQALLAKGDRPAALTEARAALAKAPLRARPAVQTFIQRIRRGE